MSQRKADIESELCKFENALAHLARLRKLLDVMEIKANYIREPLRTSILLDIAEAKTQAVGCQGIIKQETGKF